MFSLWQGRSAGMGWEFWYPPKKVNFPLSPEKKWLVKTYKDVKNIKNFPAHKGGYVNQIHTLIDKNKTKKNNHPVVTNLIKSRVHYHYSLLTRNTASG